MKIKRWLEGEMNRKIELHNDVSKGLLLHNGFKEYSYNKFSKCKILYNPLIVLRIEIDLNEMGVTYDVIDRNTQETYYPFWNNINGKNNLVAVKVIENFESYIEELIHRKILRRYKKYGKRKNNNG